jgi:hypothetical protein
MMNSCCSVYHIYPDAKQQDCCQLPEIEECDDCQCHCGYIQYEQLAPYIDRLSNSFTQDDDHIKLEARLRFQIVWVSRLFDEETNAPHGTYSKGHVKLERLTGNGTRYLRIPEFVKGTLELYTEDGCLINPQSYAYESGALVLYPCAEHTSTCGCLNTCGEYQSQRLPMGWNGCFYAKAQFGKECADPIVQAAVMAYIIEFNTFGDQKEATFQGYPVSRKFRKPDVWVDLVNRYKLKRKVRHTFAFA